jgi:carboxypeptidase family protein/TonB-dependent receptor-like protein
VAAVRSASILVVVLLIAPCPALSPIARAAANGAALVGQVVDAETSEPLAGAAVELLDLNRAVATDAEGRYLLRDVAPGPNHITVRLIGYAPRTLHALVPSSGQLEINVALRPEPVRMGSVDVPAPVALRGLENGDSTMFPDRESSVASLRNHPLLEEPDVFQALSSGEVVLMPESPSGIHLRGGASDQTAYLIDGVPVFNPFHAAGVSSAWNPDALSGMQVAAFSPSPSYSHVLSGTVDGITRQPGLALGGQGSVSTSQARLTIDGPLHGADLGFLVSGRTGFAGLLHPKKETSHLKGETGDVLAKLEWLALGGRIRLLGYDSENQIDAASVAGVEETPGVEIPRNVFEWHSRSLGAEWRRATSSATLHVQGWSAGGDAASKWAALLGPVQMSADRTDVGLRADIERVAGRTATVAGVRIERSTTSYRVESDSTGELIWALDGRTPVAAFFAEHERPIIGALRLHLGATVATAEGQEHVDPRALVRWSASPRWMLVASYAGTHQFAQSLSNSESIVGSIFPVDLYMGADAPGVPVARGRQGAIAVDYRPLAGVRATVQAYDRSLDGLLLVAPRGGEPFAMGSFVQGSSESRGVSIDAAWATAHWGVMATYGFQQVRMEYGDSSYVPDHAAKHVLEGGVVVFPNSTASIRLGASAAWGRRTTTMSGDFEWEACNLIDRGCEFSGSPHYEGEPLGATPLPSYFRLDLGLRQHWHFQIREHDFRIAVFGMATNLLGYRNVLTYTQSPSSGRTEPVTMRPRAPLVAGIEWRF